MVRYTLEQRIFLYDTNVKYGYVKKCRRKFRDERVLSRRTIQNLNKLSSAGLLTDKNEEHMRSAY
jgi:hypothetical protein